MLLELVDSKPLFSGALFRLINIETIDKKKENQLIFLFFKAYISEVFILRV